jgi:hypothetical protein
MLVLTRSRTLRECLRLEVEELRRVMAAERRQIERERDQLQISLECPVCKVPSAVCVCVRVCVCVCAGVCVLMCVLWSRHALSVQGAVCCAVCAYTGPGICAIQPQAQHIKCPVCARCRLLCCVLMCVHWSRHMRHLPTSPSRRVLCARLDRVGKKDAPLLGHTQHSTQAYITQYTVQDVGMRKYTVVC